MSSARVVGYLPGGERDLDVDLVAVSADESFPGSDSLDCLSWSAHLVRLAAL